MVLIVIFRRWVVVLFVLDVVDSVEVFERMGVLCGLIFRCSVLFGVLVILKWLLNVSLFGVG